jgi:4-hydroxybutyryl-CoA dehydratase/vinylacetyl-CoA-Delta-isomerase
MRLVETMTLGSVAVAFRTESMHGAGSPQAQRVRMAAQARFEEKMAHAGRIAGIAVPNSTPNEVG